MNLKSLALFIVVVAALLITQASYGLARPFDGIDDDRPLVQAIDKGDYARVEALLKAGADPHDFGRRDFAAVHAVAANGDVKMAQLLAKYKANFNLPDRHLQEWTPLFYAVDWGHLDMARFLLDQGADVNRRTSHGYSPLHFALSSEFSSFQLVKMLLKRSANVNAVADNKTTVLQSAVQASNPQAVDFLIKAGADPEKKTYFGSTVISDAVLDGDVATVAVLLKYKVSLKELDGLGLAPLHHAAQEGNVEIVEMLIKAGADVNQRTKDGKLPEDVAEYLDVYEYLKKVRTKR